MAERIVFKPILPKDPNMFIDAGEALVSEWASTLLGPVAKTIKEAEENYIKNWEHAPTIVAQFTHQKTQLKVLVTPYGTHKRYWAFVSLGTTGQTYGPKKGEFMPVRLGYVPKTSPGGVFNGPGSYSGEVVYAKQVQWPGIKPRHFEEQIVEKYSDTVLFHLAVATERALRKFA